MHGDLRPLVRSLNCQNTLLKHGLHCAKFADGMIYSHIQELHENAVDVAHTKLYELYFLLPSAPCLLPSCTSPNFIGLTRSSPRQVAVAK